MALLLALSAFISACSSDDAKIEIGDASSSESLKLEVAKPTLAILPEILPAPKAASALVDLHIGNAVATMVGDNGRLFFQLQESDSRLKLHFDGLIESSSVRASLRKLDSEKPQPVDLVNDTNSSSLEADIDSMLRSGHSYELVVESSLGAKSVERRAILFRPARGAIGMVFIDWDHDGRDNRITLTSDARIDFGTEGGEALPIPGMQSIVAFDRGDFDRDGRVEIAVLGLNTHGRSCVALIKRLPQSDSGFVVETISDLGIAIPTAIASIDLHRDGQPDLVITGLEGKICILVNHARESGPTLVANESDFGPLMPAGVTEICVTRDDADYLEDILLCGGDDVALLRGTRFESHGLIYANEIEESALEMVKSAFGREALRHGARAEELLSYAFQMIGLAQSSVVSLMENRTKGHEMAFAYFNDEAKSLHVCEGEDISEEVWAIESLGILNAIVANQAQGAIFLCAENGVYQLDWASAAAKPTLTFDAKMKLDRPRVLAVLPPNMRSQALVDINNDGMIDVLGIYEDEEGKRYLGVWQNLLSAGGGLSQIATFDAEGFDEALPLDVNGDGLLDVLLAAHKKGASRVLHSSPSTGMLDGEESFAIDIPDDLLGTPIVMDLNGDTFEDVVWPTKRLHVSFGSAEALGKALPMPRFFNEENTKRLIFAGMVRPNMMRSPELPGLFALVKEGRKHRLVHLENLMGYGSDDLSDFTLTTVGEAVSEVSDFVEGSLGEKVRGLSAIRLKDGEWQLVVWRDDAFVEVRNFGAREYAPTSLQVSDVDLDGDDDIAYLFDKDEDFLTLLLNRGNGHYKSESASSMALRDAATGSPLRSATLVDLNGDGKPDLLAHSVKGDAWHAASRK